MQHTAMHCQLLNLLSLGVSDAKTSETAKHRLIVPLEDWVALAPACTCSGVAGGVAVCCSVLRSVAVWRSVLQCIVINCTYTCMYIQCVAACCSELPNGAVCCRQCAAGSVLQAVCCSERL